MKNNNTIQRIDKLSNILLILIVAVPFLLSAQALKELAEQNGIAWSWLYPIMIDGALIIFNLVALRYSLYGQRSYYAWTLVIIATLVSVVLNVAHAPATGLARVMAAMPPLFILAAFHAVVMRIEEDAKRDGAVETLEKLHQRIKAAKLEADAAVQKAERTIAEKREALQAQLQKEHAAQVQDMEADLQVQTEKVKESLRVQVQELQAQKVQLEKEIASLQRQAVQAASTPASPKKQAAPVTAVSATRLKQLQKIELGLSGSFVAEDIQSLLGCSERTAYNILRVGTDAEFLARAENGTYHFNGVPLPA